VTHDEAPAGTGPAGATALERLAVYRERREHLGADVREALANGATQVEVARVSGLSRQWVARLARENRHPTEKRRAPQ